MDELLVEWTTLNGGEIGGIVDIVVQKKEPLGLMADLPPIKPEIQLSVKSP